MTLKARTDCLVFRSCLVTALAALLALNAPGEATARVATNDPPPASLPEVAAMADSTSILLREMKLLMEESTSLRRQLADCQLESTTAQRELAEVQQFIRDHHVLGKDFDEYQRIKAIREMEARQRVAEETRQQREREEAARVARRADLLKQRNAAKSEENRIRRYTDAGFSPLGLDVYASKMAFAYRAIDSESGWTPWSYTGWAVWGQPYDTRRIDYSQMIISGSIINGADEVRNIGIAMTFFDQLGNQVGHEIVQIKNARPDVPYPFTSTISMALNRPFETSSIYVLYADAVESSTPSK